MNNIFDIFKIQRSICSYILIVTFLIELIFFFFLVGFSYSRTQAFSIPGTKKGMKALVTGMF